MIVVLAGKSASGKDAVLHELIDSGFEPIVSFTTRPMREGERDGVDYHFISKEEFLKMVEEDKIPQVRSYNTKVAGVDDTWYYGSAIVDTKAADYVVVLDLGGAESYRELYGDAVRVIGIDVPDYIREERAMSRGSFDRQEWDRRLEDDTKKFSVVQMQKHCDMIVGNEGELSECVQNVKQAIETLKRAAEKQGKEITE